MLWLLLLLAWLILWLYPLKVIVAAQEDNLVYTAWQTGHLILTDNAIWKPNNPYYEPKPVYKPKTLSYNPCSCVSYARWKTGINTGPIGYAKNHPINSSTPQVGAIGITTESRGRTDTGHLFVVIAETETTITVSEANLQKCKVSQRVLEKDNPIIRGYYIAF